MRRLSNMLLIVFMFLGFYVLTYFVSVKPATLVAITAGQGPWSRMPEYRFGLWSESFYEPMLRLDRRLFPGRWQVTRAEVQNNGHPSAVPQR